MANESVQDIVDQFCRKPWSQSQSTQPWNNVAYVYLPLLQLSLGVPLIIICLMVLKKFQSRTSKAYFLLKLLALSDLAALVLYVTTMIYHWVAANGLKTDNLYNIIKGFSHAGVVWTTWTAVIVGLERCIAVCRPIKSRLFSTKSVVIIIAGIHVFAATLYTCHAVINWTYKIKKNESDLPSNMPNNSDFKNMLERCDTKYKVEHLVESKVKKDLVEVFDIFILVVAYVIPVFLLALVDVQIVRKLRQLQRSGPDRAQGVRKAVIARRGTKVVAASVFVHCTCLIPMAAYHVIIIANNELSNDAFKLIVDALLHLHTILTLPAYCAVGKSFRTALRIFASCVPTSQNSPTNMEGSTTRASFVSMTSNKSS